MIPFAGMTTTGAKFVNKAVHALKHVDEVALAAKNDAYMGQLDSFATFYRSGRIFELPIGWPNIKAIKR